MKKGMERNHSVWIYVLWSFKTIVTNASTSLALSFLSQGVQHTPGVPTLSWQSKGDAQAERFIAVPPALSLCRWKHGETKWLVTGGVKTGSASCSGPGQSMAYQSTGCFWLIRNVVIVIVIGRHGVISATNESSRQHSLRSKQIASHCSLFAAPGRLLWMLSFLLF